MHFGHGTDNARDEAAELVFFVAGLAHALGAGAYARELTPRQAARIDALLQRRIAERMPLAYLTHRAFFAGLELYVDERVLVPRSPIAELVLNRFRAVDRLPPRAPHPGYRHRIRRDRAGLRQGLSARAGRCGRYLRRGIAGVPAQCAQLGLGRRVTALQSDYFSGVAGRRYDIIVSNPPYVGRAEMRALPREYRHEPRLGLASGARWLGVGAGNFAPKRDRTSRMTASWSWRSAIPRRRCCGRFRGCRLSGRGLRWAAGRILVECAGSLTRQERTGVAGNTFGRIFTVTSFGESHGPALGCVVDGCPPGLELTEAELQMDVDRRRPGTSQFTSQRHEPDTVRILSGVFEGKTTGTPIGLMVENEDQRSRDYEKIKDRFRPGHADYTYQQKYGFRDYRGGGRSSARETVVRVAAGAIARKYLARAAAHQHPRISGADGSHGAAAGRSGGRL